MVIQPEVFVTPDRPVVRFREPREKVDLGNELPKVIHAQGWGIGTYFNVQFIDHDRTTLIASAEFLVTEVREGLHTSESNPYQPVTKTVFMRKYEQVSRWWEHSQEMKVREKLSDEMTTSWNPGKKVHQVKKGDKVIFESPDKELALQVAEGKIPIPEAA